MDDDEGDDAAVDVAGLDFGPGLKNWVDLGQNGHFLDKNLQTNWYFALQSCTKSPGNRVRDFNQVC